MNCSISRWPWKLQFIKYSFISIFKIGLKNGPPILNRPPVKTHPKNKLSKASKTLKYINSLFQPLNNKHKLFALSPL